MAQGREGPADRRHEAELRALINATQPLYDFTSLVPAANSIFNCWRRMDLPTFLGKPLIQSRDSIIQAFNAIGSLDDPMPQFLVEFRKLCHATFKPNILSEFVNSWPPAVPQDAAVHSFVLFFVDQIRISRNPLLAVHWARDNFVSPGWCRSPSSINKILHVICLARVAADLKANLDQLYWFTVDTTMHFEVRAITPTGLHRVFHGTASTVQRSRNGGTLRAVDTNHRPMYDYFVPIDDSQIDIWHGQFHQEIVPFIERLTSQHKWLPDILYRAMYEAVTSDDLLFARTLLHPSVTKVADGAPLAEALLDIFAHCRKVNAFLLAIVASEFDAPVDDPSKILRTNSHLTNLFKVFVDRYTEEYRAKVITKMSKFIIDAGDLGLKAEVQRADLKRKTQKMIFACLNVIVRSGRFISAEIRHMASVLKAVVACRFNNKQATFCALSGFFYLRFLSVFLASPQKPDQETDLLFPFVQLLQVPFNGNLYGGKHAQYIEWNHQMCHEFPDMINFILSVADSGEQPEYAIPSDDVMEGAMELVVRTVLENRQVFLARYQQLAKGEDGATTPGWGLASFMLRFFKDTAGDSL